MSAREVCAEARRLLKGKWSLSLAVALTLGGALLLLFYAADVFLYLCGTVDYETNAVTLTDTALLGAFYALLLCAVLFLIEPLLLGAARFFLLLSQGETPPIATLFYVFSKERYAGALYLDFLLLLSKGGWTLLCLLPGLYCFGTVLEIPLLAVGGAVSVIVNLRYFFVRYCYASGRLSPVEAWQRGIFLSRGRKSVVLVLKFGFLPWWLLTVCTVGVSLLYTVPYYFSSLAVCAEREIKKDFPL